MKRTPLQRRGFLARGTGLTRTPFVGRRGKSRAERRSPWTEGNGRKTVEARSTGCEACGNAPGAEWHHRKKRSQGGTWAPSNGLHCCSACHRWIHANPDAATELGWLVPRDADPAAVPIEYPQWGRVLLDDHGGIHLYRESAEAS